jgi:hypothetical protein
MVANSRLKREGGKRKKRKRLRCKVGKRRYDPFTTTCACFFKTSEFAPIYYILHLDFSGIHF